MEPQIDTLERIVMQAQMCDCAACLRLIHQFQGLLCAVARKYQSTCGYEEVYQEACAAFLTAIQSYRPDRGPFVAYAASKVRGDVRTAMRRLWRVADRWSHIHAFEGEDDERAFDRVLAGSNADAVGTTVFPDATWTTSSALNEMITRARLSQREGDWLHSFLAGWPPEAMAEAYDVSAETVKTWRKRALSKLRRAAAQMDVDFRDFV
ncbi:sigma-70 family RNA polymerase sigma factor [Alicyclobacillus fastidiosus]|uniref:RNA polymerase sigma factor SigS n=1 Tax=Alicyclobacillus fastidiosus TaxID=392011 RepID=A0ABY6ZG33_9BACL|nr:sigma-70 family RNA polymerase sigma factor [Alicyclobacillus fastidiosus]WAH41822.1 sigma-70 family RNA polymerase sigma factor [Alicyclobacillus fastidiosus]